MICLYCGEDAGAGSMGGPNVCSPCDCGYTRDIDGTVRKWDPRDAQYQVLMGKREPFREKPAASDIGSTLALALVCALSISRAFGVWGIELSEQGVPAQRHDVMGASPAVYIHPERGKSRTVWTRGAASPGPQLALGVGLVSSGGAS